MKPFNLILVLIFALFVITSKADEINDINLNDLDDEIIGELLDDIIKNYGSLNAVVKNDSKCANAGGQCMNPNNCKNGTVKTGLCPGGNDNKCCVRSTGKKTNNSNSSKCANAGGQCMNPNNCKNGTVKTGLCPGGNDNKCCVRKKTPSNSNKCANAGGTCMNPKNCKNGTVKTGLCPGGNDNKCCVKDNSNGGSGGNSSGSQQEFITKVANLAVQEASNRKKRGEKWVLPSVCIAQAALESNWGKSTLMKKANAYFGIKAGKNWKGRVFSTKTKECYDGVNMVSITDAFRAYNSLGESIADYYDLITKNSRYSAACNKTDAKATITAIKNGGYATDPNYVSKVMSIINKHNLTKYDSF